MVLKVFFPLYILLKFTAVDVYLTSRNHSPRSKNDTPFIPSYPQAPKLNGEKAASSPTGSPGTPGKITHELLLGVLMSKMPLVKKAASSPTGSPGAPGKITHELLLGVLMSKMPLVVTSSNSLSWSSFQHRCSFI